MKNWTQRKLVTLAMLVGLSVLLMFMLQIPYPVATFLVYDMADIPILIATFIFGPVSGLITTAAVAAIEAATVGQAGGLVGALMHFFATGTLVLVAGLFYKWLRTRKGAIWGLVLGSIAMALVMIPLNLIFDVYFYGMPQDQVIAIILPAIIPFNLIKAGLNSAIAFLVYKPISRVLKLEKKDGLILQEARQKNI